MRCTRAYYIQVLRRDTERSSYPAVLFVTIDLLQVLNKPDQSLIDTFYGIHVIPKLKFAHLPLTAEGSVKYQHCTVESTNLMVDRTDCNISSTTENGQPNMHPYRIFSTCITLTKKMLKIHVSNNTNATLPSNSKERHTCTCTC